MRKIIWIGGHQPAAMDDATYEYSVKFLAEAVGGECIRFGTGYVIIGDDKADGKMKELEAEKRKAVATS